MEKSKRAERMIAFVRWLVFSCLLTEAWRLIPRYHLYTIIGFVIVYNCVTIICLTDGRYERFGRIASSFARFLDIVIIAAISFYTHSPSLLANIAYVLVMLGVAASTSSAAKVTLTFVVVTSACAGPTIYSMGHLTGSSELVRMIEMRGIILSFGWLLSLYIAVSRSRSALASEMQSLLSATYSCGAQITGHTSLRELGEHILRSVVCHGSADGGQLWLVDKVTNELKCEAFYTADSSAQPVAGSFSTVQEAAHNYAYTVTGTEKEILIQVDVRGTNATRAESDTRPFVAVPLRRLASEDISSQVFGAIVIWGTPGRCFSRIVVNIVRAFAAMSSGAIEGLLLCGKVQRSYLSALQDLARIVEERDLRTRGHSLRVMQISCLIGERLGISAEAMDILRNAALLHDIGKIDIPYWLFTQVDGSTTLENETKRRHTIVGEEICQSIGLQPEITFLVKHHHESLDGRGYPDSLPAQEQPLLQRILAAANSFDNIFCRRQYSSVSPQSMLHSELRRAAGTTMDPSVVDVLLQIIESGKLDSVYANYVGIGYTPSQNNQSLQRRAS